MIISKDLFLLGEQDYLRLPSDNRGSVIYTSGMEKTQATNNRKDHTTLTFPYLMEQSRPIHLIFQNITASVEGEKVLRDISGIASPGQLLAIMGPSGCGKTTLLDCLSGHKRIDSGNIFINREKLSKKWRRKICYVLQEEIFFTSLTLRETLEYTAKLRLPEKIPDADKMRLIDRILDVLELTSCQCTKIGDYLNRGLSGGEKKRANIACELLTNPSIMLLDEPTSGLDSHAAASLINTLQNFALQENKTIITTVHQPSSQMFHMFDKLLLLYNGRPAYFGNTDQIVNFFQDVGATMKPYYNPADFILEVLKSSPGIREKLFLTAKNSEDSIFNSIDLKNSLNGKVQRECLKDVYAYKHINKNDQLPPNKKNFEEIQQLWVDTQSNFSSSSSEYQQNEHLGYTTGFFTQLKVLSERNFKEARPRMLSNLNWIQTIGLGLMAGAIWFQLPRTEEYLHDIQGWMFFSQTYWMLFALFGALSSFPPEREIISKERRSGAYRLSAYYLAKMIGELPLIITLPTFYHAISYPMMGFTSTKLFLLMLAFLLLNTVVAQSVGFFIGACCLDMNFSITVSALYTLATQLFGGYLSSRFPDGLSWARYTSMIHYAYQNMQILEFGEGLPIRCAKYSSFTICKENVSDFIPLEDILAQQGCSSPLWLNTLVLLGFFIVFRLLGYIILRYIRCPKT